MTDRELLALFMTRDERAVEATSTKYSRLIRGCIRGIMPEKSDIDECENDVYLKLWQLIPPDEPENFSAYICKTARYLAMNALKKKSRNKRSAYTESSFEELSEDIIGNSLDPESSLESRELAGIVSDFLKTKPKEQRIMFIQRYWYYASVTEIAQSLGVSKAKVSVTLTRLRKELREMLLQQGYKER